MHAVKLGKSNIYFIYSTGPFARDKLDILTRHKLTVSDFIDHSRRQSAIKELPIMSLDAIPQNAHSSTSVILGIRNRQANIAAIISRLKSLGFEK